MAGTLFGLGLSQQVSASGVPLSGALLYIYQENSSTPVTTYSDFTLATEQTFPIEADSAGRLPQIWVADGSYRARLTTSAGVEVFDEASVTAIGASSGSSGGGGGSSVDATTIFQTGDTIWVPYSGTRTGWVRHNGRTIGSGSSAATERANADAQDLFEYLWNNFSNSLCAVGGGRGANATADFNANKAIATLNMRNRAPLGLDDMGNTAAGVISANTTAGAGGGGYLPHYHEASWTPAIAFGGSATSVAYTTQVGRYVRVDDLITVWGTIVLSNNGSDTGAVTITGLPYAASTVSGLIQSGSVGHASNIGPDGSGTPPGASAGLFCSVASGASVVDLWIGEGESAFGDDYVALTHDGGSTAQDVTNTAAISFSLTYRTDDTTAGTTGTNPVLYIGGTWFAKL
jgi:hypothetical protein